MTPRARCGKVAAGMNQNLLCLLAASLALVRVQAATPAAAKPNIVFILADDLGYGDVHCLNPERDKIATPHIDRLAAEGMTFTDAHSTSAVCTPSRYGILTGRYNWRSRLQSGVLGGFSPPLIAPARLTVAELLKENGYQTACIGKWHLGLTFARKNGKRDLAGPISDGPLQHGFDYFFGIAASLDMPPFAFIENDHFTQVPSVTKKFVRSGLAAPDFEAVDVLPELVRKAKSFVAASVTAKKPFFLYLPLNAPHTPLVPTKEWQGKSGLGDYGDYVMETDWAIGEVLAALDQDGVAGNTLVLLASDNGVAPYVGVGPEQLKQLEAKGFSVNQEEHGSFQRYKELEAMGQYSSYVFRGHKSDIWDGGHRIPLFVRWPGRVKAGSTSDQLVSLVDFMATCADITGAKIPAAAGEDSVSLLPILLGTATAPIHQAVVFHSINGSFAIQQGRWKLELCPGSGGWGEPRPGSEEAQGLPPVQLYDLARDVGERTNECAAHPEIVTELTTLLEKYVADGRTTAGPPEHNDVPVNLWKAKPSAKDKNGKPAGRD